jgi:hypothetical protein
MWDMLYLTLTHNWGGYQLTGMGGQGVELYAVVQGPNSAPVAWKRQYSIGGIVGGDNGV